MLNCALGGLVPGCHATEMLTPGLNGRSFRKCEDGSKIVDELVVTVGLDKEILGAKLVALLYLAGIGRRGVHDNWYRMQVRRAFQGLQALFAVHHRHVDVEKNVVGKRRPVFKKGQRFHATTCYQAGYRRVDLPQRVTEEFAIFLIIVYI